MHNFLYETYRSELFGIAFFNAFAERAKNTEQRQKWQSLVDLEIHTATLLKTWLDNNGRPCEWEDPEMTAKGQGIAAPWLGLEWQALMETLENWITSYAVKYREEAKTAPAEQYWIYDMTATHEEAILVFVQAEKIGNNDSLQAVRDFMAKFPLA